MDNNKKIGIIGSPDAVLGFRALGLVTFAVNNKEEVIKSLASVKDDYAIVFITEDWAAEVPEELTELRQLTLPALIAIPSQLGASGQGIKDLRQIVERAVGSDILFKE